MVDKKVKRLYRILDFSHVVQIFEKKELYFSRPAAWDDPYETLFKHSEDHAIFAQCWSQKSISDAMWRIYSKNGMGVRISTTEEKLRGAMDEAVMDNDFNFQLRKVMYIPKKDVDLRAAQIADNTRKIFVMSDVVDMLYIKRRAFSHEGEWRATLFCPSEKRDNEKKGVTIKIDPYSLIDNILLDPMAPVELVQAFQFYFEKKLKFKGKVGRSTLYKTPVRYSVSDDVMRVNDLLM